VPLIHVETWIAAPIERCFDLMRSVDLHTASTATTREKAVGGKTSGLLDTGDVVTWEAVHLGVRQRLTVRVTRCDRPTSFEDVMVRGAFARFTHRHAFREEHGGTLMLDDFGYTAPLGVQADRLFLERYMRRFLRSRAAFLKRTAESGAAAPGAVASGVVTPGAAAAGATAPGTTA